MGGLRFHNRIAAGRQLGITLHEQFRELTDGLVLAIPRGGVVVGAQVARALGWPLEVLITKKIGAPGNPEYAIGAVGPDGTVVLEPEAAQWPRAAVAMATRIAQQKVREYREKLAAGQHPDVHNKTVILVDDGIATGQTVALALRWLRQQAAGRIILAVPVAPPDTLARLRALADAVVVLATPANFHAIGQFYDDFTQITDDEVARILEQSQRDRA